VFYYLGDNNSIIDLTGYSARCQARITSQDASPLTGFDLSTANGGLLIVTGTAPTPFGNIPNAQGIQMIVPSVVTSAITWGKALYSIHLIAPDLSVIPMVSGLLLPQVDVTK
jgi:hypothetical protein